MSEDTPALPRAFTTPISTPKHDKVTKDGFIPVKAEPKAPISFLPYEVRSDPEVSEQLDHYLVLPDSTMGLFREYARHIPYSSSKKDFFQKTGLHSLNGKSVILVHGFIQLICLKHFNSSFAKRARTEE